MTELSNEALMRLISSAVPEVARRAVQVPSIRFGTVAETPDSLTTFVSVQIDGEDDQATAVLNGTAGPLGAGQRVVVLFYPPHGAIVIGELVPKILTEQIWHGSYSVASSAADAASHAGGWALLTPQSIGWNAVGDDLTCVVPGLWEVSIHASWASSGLGTHRAAAAMFNGAHLVRTSHQFAGGAGSPTGGFGLAGAGGPVPTPLAVVGDTLSTIARQDSGGALDVEVWLKVKLAGPSA